MECLQFVPVNELEMLTSYKAPAVAVAAESKSEKALLLYENMTDI